MNILTGCLSATEGSVRIDGFDIFEEPKKAKKRIGYLPEQPPLYMNETPAEYLRFVGEAKGIRGRELERQIDSVVEQVGIGEVRNRCISALSKGMASMLTIVLALASRAPITFMDEPVAGLDVVAREDFYRLLLDDYAETGRTFVISTHILEEASNVFEKVLIMKEGRLIEACDADELLAQFCAVTGRDDVVNKACAGLNILHTETLGRQKSCVVRVPAETMAAKGLDVDCTSLPLQKVFVALCGHEQELQEHREG